MAEALPPIQVKDIMTTKIVAAQAADSVVDVARLMLQKNFDGLPVVDKNHRLIGMVTMRELLDRRGEYLPTVAKLLTELKIQHPRDETEIDEKLRQVKNLKVESVMSRKPHYLAHDASLEQAAEAMVLWREDPLPVTDSFGNLVGIVAKYDILKALTPTLPTRLAAKPELTVETEPLNVVESLGKKFVVISRTRMRFWYLAFFVFLGLGIVIALALILRIRIL